MEMNVHHFFCAFIESISQVHLLILLLSFNSSHLLFITCSAQIKWNMKETTKRNAYRQHNQHTILIDDRQKEQELHTNNTFRIEIRLLMIIFHI